VAAVRVAMSDARVFKRGAVRRSSAADVLAAIGAGANVSAAQVTSPPAAQQRSRDAFAFEAEDDALHATAGGAAGASRTPQANGSGGSGSGSGGGGGGSAAAAHPPPPATASAAKRAKSSTPAASMSSPDGEEGKERGAAARRRAAGVGGSGAAGSLASPPPRRTPQPPARAADPFAFDGSEAATPYDAPPARGAQAQRAHARTHASVRSPLFACSAFHFRSRRMCLPTHSLTRARAYDPRVSAQAPKRHVTWGEVTIHPAPPPLEFEAEEDDEDDDDDDTPDVSPAAAHRGGGAGRPQHDERDGGALLAGAARHAAHSRGGRPFAHTRPSLCGGNAHPLSRRMCLRLPRDTHAPPARAPRCLLASRAAVDEARFALEGLSASSPLPLRRRCAADAVALVADADTRRLLRSHKLSTLLLVRPSLTRVCCYAPGGMR
jgi:hypothetical protein